MEPNCNNLNERLLQLTLEIVYLLTGEDNIVVSKTLGDGQNSVMVPLHSLLIPERKNEQKILIVTQNIIDLLMGESEKWNNFNIRIKEEIKAEQQDSMMKERECLEGHKDLYKNVKLENQPPLTSPDGSSNRNPPERCPRPLYSRDSTQEDLTIPHQHQGTEMIDMKIVVKEEEEMYIIDHERPIKEDEVIMTVINEGSSLNANTGGGHNGWTTREGRIILSADHNEEGNAMAQYSRAGCEQLFIRKHDPDVHQSIHTSENRFSCPSCEKTFLRKSHLVQHLRIHTGKKPFTCLICGKAFIEKSQLNRHQRVHTGEKPFSCFVCGRCFSDKGNCDKHLRVHTGEKPFSCQECGKCFAQKVTLIIHQTKTHNLRPLEGGVS